ncbi:MAG: methyltransferase domain-containing protein [Bacteroidetes bacterium]|nr:methyltransferase domain-containing protein [Bacteroidota bacterium]
MDKKLFILFLIALIGLTSATLNPKFSYKIYGNVANFFETENDFRNFFDFHTGDTIAEVGALHGENMYGFTIVTDSVTFYVQDIDSIALSQTNFDKVVKHCKKLKKPLTNKFYRCIGTAKQTNLPDNSFDKILLIMTFHEFTFMDEMMTDIYKKLKPAGQLYILETHCFTSTHKNYTANETIEMMKKYNFSLLKKDGKDINNSSGLYRTVFKKI